MTIPSADMRTILIDAGVGTDATGNTPWRVFIGTEPASPDAAITIYDTGGEAPNPLWLLDNPTFQVRVRGPSLPTGYQQAYEKQLEIKNALLGFPSGLVNNVWYVGVWQVSDIVHIGESEVRPLLTSNWRVIREPPDDGGHRKPL